jgi:hypothetical protein
MVHRPKRYDLVLFIVRGRVRRGRVIAAKGTELKLEETLDGLEWRPVVDHLDLRDERITWCRGWDSGQFDALEAAYVLSR